MYVHSRGFGSIAFLFTLSEACVFVVDMHGKSVGGRGPPGPAVCLVYCASRVFPQPDLGREMTSWELDGRRMVQKKRGYMAPRSRSTQPFTLCGAVK